MRTSRSVIAAALFSTFASTPVLAAQQFAFEIGAGPLGGALASFAQQARANIGTADPGVASARSPGVRGVLSPRTALNRLLKETGYRAVQIDDTTFRIVRQPHKTSTFPAASAPATSQASAPEIVVTASKRAAPLLRFPGSVTIIPTYGQTLPGSGATRDMHGISATMPILQTTELGDGRNKLFIRGVADSSFAGPTRSTATVYFGEAQLGYNSADPNLNLYDVGRVEVLEGPQGALYGAGSIGGVIRLTPNAPQLGTFASSGSAAIAGTKGGAAGYELAAMINVPLIGDAAALRLVGYGSRDGGYVDDVGRQLSNINRSRTIGGRAALRVKPGDGWTVDLGFVGQRIEAPDTQYVIHGMGGLARSSTIAQPFEGDFQLGELVVGKVWDSGLQLISATGMVKHHSDDRFDATSRLRPNSPIAYDTHDRNRLVTHEIRLSRSVSNGNSWLVGLSYLDDNDAIQRELGPVRQPLDITGIINRATDLSAFGEGTLALTSTLSITAGSRLTHTQTESTPTFVRAGASYLGGRKSTRLSPMLAAEMLLSPRLVWFARYGSGFRTGGLAVAPGVGRVADFTPDTIRVVETGLRLQRNTETGLSASASLSHARWRDIQADLIDRRGFPYTTNIGSGRISGFEANADWVPVAGLSIGAAIFLNRSELSDPIIALSRQDGDDLADTPRLSANGRVAYRWKGGESSTWSLSATGQYTGRSFVGFGPALDIPQGNYATAAADAGWQGKTVSVLLSVDNLFNGHGNRFAMGNPFGVADRNQETPVRPRTGRLTLSFKR